MNLTASTCALRLARTTFILGSLIAAAFAQAAPTTYSSREQWTAAINQTGGDDFEDHDFHTGVDNGQWLAWSITSTKTWVGGEVTYRPTGVLYGIESVTYDATFFQNQYIEWQAGGQQPTQPNTLSITLAGEVTALGFDFAMFYGEARIR